MNTKTAMITIAGRPNVGKSTLTNYLVGEKIAIVSNKPQTTRNRICGILTRGETQFVFVDTPGFHRPRTKLGDFMVNVARESIADVDLTLLVVEPIPAVGPQEEGLIQKIQAIGCPGIAFSAKAEGPKSGKRGQAYIGGDLCNGCGLCSQICPFEAIGKPAAKGGANA